jgi:hypothetical protein
VETAESWHSAWVEADGVRLDFSCLDGLFAASATVDDERGFGSVPNMDELDLTLSIDPGGATGRSVTVKTEIVSHHGGGNALYQTFDEEAHALADLAVRAAETVEVSISPDADATNPAAYRLLKVPAAGAAAAILSVTDTCVEQAADAPPDTAPADPVSPPDPARWTTRSDEAGRVMALAVTEDDAALAFDCQDAGMVFAFSFPQGTLSPEFAEGQTLDLTFAIDRRADGTAHMNWIDIGASESDGRTRFQFRGSLVDAWAANAIRADRSIEVALTEDADAQSYTLHNVAVFPARGSTAAIRAALESCR